MDESGVGSVAAAVEETVGDQADPVSIQNIFKDESPDKKVIVLQSQEMSSENVEGQLPDLTDAVAAPDQSQGEPAHEPNHEMPADEAQSGPADAVSATEIYDELNNANDESSRIPEPDPNFVTEVVQDIQTVDQNSDEIIFIDSEQVKDQDIQFIEMATEMNPVEQLEQPQTLMETVEHDQGPQQVEVQGLKRPVRPPLQKLSEPVYSSPRKTTYISRDDIKTRFLCPVCEKSFRQKHLLLCHLKLHENPSKTKSTSVYMSNCTTCGGNVRLTSEQARLLQERGTEDARIICSTCKLLGHDVMQPKTQNAVPIELKPAYNFNCDLCGCDIKLTDDQLQLVDRKGAENIRIICAPCSTKDQDQISGNPEMANLKCNVCHRIIVVSNQESIDLANPICAECQAKYATDETAVAVENMQEEHDGAQEQDCLQYSCTICTKELFLTSEPQNQSDLICPDCKIPKRFQKTTNTRPPTFLTPTGRNPRFPNIKGVREVKPPEMNKVDGLAVMYKCNNCFCSMQVSEDQKQMLRARGVSGLKIICSACNIKGKPLGKKKANLYQCDICLTNMPANYVPSHDDDVICEVCRRAELRANQVKNLNTKKNALYKCTTCLKYLPMTDVQAAKIFPRNSRLQCEPCRKKGLNASDVKPASLPIAEDRVDYRCDICNLNFGSNFDKFAVHFEKFHIPPESQMPKRIMIRCPICDYGFSDRNKLKLHLSRHRPKKFLQRPCPTCGEKFGKKAMFDHYRTAHGINIETEMYIFKYAEELKSWKEELETSTCSKFICFDQKAFMVKSMPVVNLRCQWSSMYKSKLVKARTCVFCPANIKIRVTRQGIFTVDFTKTHVGHELLTDEFSLEEIELMKGYLREGKTVDDIVTELCKELSTESEEYSRFYQLKNYDEYCLSLKLGDWDLIKKFRRADISEDSGALTSDCEMKPDWVDLPKPLEWLKEEAVKLNDEIPASETPQPKTTAKANVIVGNSDDNYQLHLFTPSVLKQHALAQKKMDVLKRVTDILNKCTADEHFDILEIYLSPCEQTLTELTSGKKVEVIGDDEIESTTKSENEATGPQNDVAETEDAAETEVVEEPMVKRVKTDDPN